MLHADFMELSWQQKLDEVKRGLSETKATIARLDKKYGRGKYERKHMTEETKASYAAERQKYDAMMAEHRRFRDEENSKPHAGMAGDYLGNGCMGTVATPSPGWDANSTSRPGISAVVNELVSEDTIAVNRLHKLRELQDLVNRNPEVVRMLDLMEDLLFKR